MKMHRKNFNKYKFIFVSLFFLFAIFFFVKANDYKFSRFSIKETSEVSSNSSTNQVNVRNVVSFKPMSSPAKALPHGACYTCHIIHPVSGGQITLVDGNANLCMSCHNPVGSASSMPFTNAMKAVPGVSGTSHAWNAYAINTVHETNLPTSAMFSKLVNDTVVCSTCHNQHYQTYTPFLRISNADDAMCKDCHSLRNIMRYSDNQANKGSHPVNITYPVLDSRFFATPQNSMVLVNAKVECSSCHSVHNAASTDGYLLRQTNNDVLCTSCHTYSSHQGMGCTTCHQTHNTSKANILMIKDIIQTPNSGTKNVLFTLETGTNSFADGDATYNGVCEVCHTTVAYQRNNASGDHTHKAGANCTSCHPHSNNFSPPSSCNSCHNPGGAHNTHTVKYSYSCSTCHFQRGSLTPYHVNDINDVNFDPNGMAKRNGADGNIPTWNSVTKTCSNVYCHSNGRTAFRGQDTYFPDSADTYIWAGILGPQTATYTVTPSWETGTIITCTPCHPGTGNMTSPYLISAPFSTVRPASGRHGTANHTDNDKSFSSYGWTNVQCFWCHNVDGASANGPNYQGTYGTVFHVDGQTRFKPTTYGAGGTMANGMDYAFDGVQAHCGNGFSCW